MGPREARLRLLSDCQPKPDYSFKIGRLTITWARPRNPFWDELVRRAAEEDLRENLYVSYLANTPGPIPDPTMTVH